MLELYVADSGEGFPPEFIGKAFDPFTRADIGRSRRDGGAGLGLAIVKGVAEAHGGSASAANRAGGGAIVTLHLPL
jgi:signal transduction histidine kinase